MVLKGRKQESFLNSKYGLCFGVGQKVVQQIGLQCKSLIYLQVLDFQNTCICVFLALCIFCGFRIFP